MHICIAVLAITLPKGGTHLDEALWRGCQAIDVALAGIVPGHSFFQMLFPLLEYLDEI